MNPFLTNTDKALVAIKGERAGYIQIAASSEVTLYQDLPEEILIAAKNWAVELEKMGAKKVYWITLSEVVTHLHIHLYPRWTDNEAKGLPLFEKRNTAPQPAWTTEMLLCLNAWADAHNTALI